MRARESWSSALFLLIGALPLAACAQVDQAVVQQGAAAGAPIQNSPCQAGASGLTIALANNTGRPDDQVSWYLQQQPAGLAYPELVAGPFTFADKRQITCEKLTAGQIYFTVGTQGSVAPPQPHPSPSATQPAYGAPSILWEPKRFQAVELTYPGMANLTAVDMIGIPVDMTSSSGDSRTFTCYTDKLQAMLKRTLRATPGAPSGSVSVSDDISYQDGVLTNKSGEFLRLLSPNINPGTPGYPKFDDYLNSLTGTELQVKATRNVDYSQYTYDYRGKVGEDGSIVLRSAGSDPGSLDLTIPAGTLSGNNGVPDQTGIYGNNSKYLVGTGAAAKEKHVGDNDIYAAIYRDLVAGFSYGFWRAGGANDSSQFDTSKAPGPFAGAQPDHPGYYNIWAATLWPATRAYGFAFEDRYTKGTRHPLMTLPDGGTITFTLQPDTTPADRDCP